MASVANSPQDDRALCVADSTRVEDASQQTLMVQAILYGRPSFRAKRAQRSKQSFQYNWWFIEKVRLFPSLHINYKS